MNHLALWVVTALVATAGIGVTTIGLTASTPLVLLHTPAVLAAMLFARAAVLVLLGRSIALQWGTRRVMGGKAWLWGPALLLLAWTAVRESGIFEMNACSHATSTEMQCVLRPWTDRQDEPLLVDQRIRVIAPPDVFGRAIDDEVVDGWLYGLRAVHAEITVDAETPFAPWPLYKSTELHCTVRGVVQLHPASNSAKGPVRCSSFEITLAGTFPSFGFSSQRNHREWIGQSIGETIRTELQDLVGREPQ